MMIDGRGVRYIDNNGGTEGAEQPVAATGKRTLTVDQLQEQVKSNTLPAVRPAGCRQPPTTGPN